MYCNYDFKRSEKMLKLVQKFLQINRYSEIKNEFKDLFLSHPNYPSLFAITDSLDLLSVENAAVEFRKNKLLIYHLIFWPTLRKKLY